MVEWCYAGFVERIDSDGHYTGRVIATRRKQIWRIAPTRRPDRTFCTARGSHGSGRRSNSVRRTLFSRTHLLPASTVRARRWRVTRRAWRYAPEQVSILHDITSLAFRLKHSAVAGRYAVLAAERDPQKPSLLRQLAIYVRRQGEWERAIALLQTARKLEQQHGTVEDHDVSALLLNLELGRLHFLMENFALAADEFKPVFEALVDHKKHGLTKEAVGLIRGDPNRTYAIIAESFLAADEFELAERAFRELATHGDESTWLPLRLARVHARRGNTKQALQQLDAFFEKSVAHAGDDAFELLTTLIRKQHKDKTKSQAVIVEKLRDLHQRVPKNSAISLAYGRVLMKLDRFDDALPILKAAVADQPSDDLYATLLQLHLHQRNHEATLQVLGSVASQHGSLQTLGSSLDALIADRAFADKLLETVQKQMSDIPDLMDNKMVLGAGYLALELKQFDVAKPLLGHMIDKRIDDTMSVATHWGMSLVQVDQLSEAASVFQRALKVVPFERQRATLEYFLAGVYATDGKTEKAVRVAKSAVKRMPDSVRFQERLAWVYYQAEWYDDAEREYLSLLEQHDDDHSSSSAREIVHDIRMILSNICVKTDRVLLGEEWLEQVLDEWPEDVGALNDLGYLWADGTSSCIAHCEWCEWPSKQIPRTKRIVTV